MKKKIYLSAIFAIFLFSTTLAQIEKNDWILGGTLGYNTSTLSNSTGASLPTYQNSTSNTNITPHNAYALGKNSTLGLNLGYSYSDNSSNNKLSSFMSNIFYKKYFPCKEKFGIYLQLYAGIFCPVILIRFMIQPVLTQKLNLQLMAIMQAQFPEFIIS